MPFTLRLFRRFPVCCPVKYEANVCCKLHRYVGLCNPEEELILEGG